MSFSPVSPEAASPRPVLVIWSTRRDKGDRVGFAVPSAVELSYEMTRCICQGSMRNKPELEFCPHWCHRLGSPEADPEMRIRVVGIHWEMSPGRAVGEPGKGS